MSEPTETNNETLTVESDTDVTTARIVEALILSTDVPLPASKLAQLLGVGNAKDVAALVDTLNAEYESQGASFRIESIAKGYQILTLSAFDPWVSKLHKARAESRLSKAALETLAIVAYKQPALRAEIEAIRGVAAGDILVRLREMNLVRIVGRAEEIGRPLLYGTTPRFLEVFGLATLKKLPKLEEDAMDGVPPLAPPAEDSGITTSDENEDETDVVAADSLPSGNDDQGEEIDEVVKLRVVDADAPDD